jgi:hypothetical protein
MQLTPHLLMHAIVQWFPCHCLQVWPLSFGSTTSTKIHLERGSFWRTTLQLEPIVVFGMKNTYISQWIPIPTTHRVPPWVGIDIGN